MSSKIIINSSFNSRCKTPNNKYKYNNNLIKYTNSVKVKSFKKNLSHFNSIIISGQIKYHEFFINNNLKNKNFKHKNNYISTTKYNIITFIPKSLIIQFSRLSNVYFLLTAIIQSLPIVSPFSSFTAIVPLLFVLSVSMIRELIEDLQRFKYDKMNNEENIIVYRNNKFINEKSENLQIGEIILIKENNPIPCDLILLDTSLNDGICYLETSSLDGEKSLKEKISCKITSNKFNLICNQKNCNIYDLYDFDIEGFVQCDLPNPNFHKFDGKFKIKIFNVENKEFYPINIKQLVLKGSILKNTKWILGIVVYTGMKNKIILNSETPRIKISKTEKKLNIFLVFIFIFQMILCLICVFLYYKYYKINSGLFDLYLILDYKIIVSSILNFFTYFLLLNTLIPISLIITIEIVKMIQSFFINWDCELYSKIYKKFCQAKTSSIIDELGNVNYIFSDKTGTLTTNNLIFKYCIIGTDIYEYKNQLQNGKVIEEQEDNKEVNKISLNLIKKMNKMSFDLPNHNLYINNINNSENNFKFISHKSQLSISNSLNKNLSPIKHIANNYFNNLIREYKNTHKKKELSDNLKLINDFWLALSLANECKCTENNNYSGVSPDDLILVKTASSQGFSLIPSPLDYKYVLINGVENKFKILNVISFSSERRRMSIIVKNLESNEIKLYCKGADCELNKRMSSKSVIYYDNIIKDSIEKYSSKGYRTLVIAEKTIDEIEYENWNREFQKNEINLRKKNNLLNYLYDSIENDLNILGVTIVEDKLQDLVPETIRDLRLANIKIWVLTGDKVNTAHNIALSCNLINKNYQNFIIKPFDKERKNNDFSLELEQFFQEFNEFSNNELNSNQNSSSPKIKNNNNENVKKFNNSNKNEEEEEKNNNNYHIYVNEIKYNNFNNENKNNEDYEDNNSLNSKHNFTPFSIIIESIILNEILANPETTKQFFKIAVCASTVICCRTSPLQKSQVVKVMKKFDKKAITLAIGDGGNDVSMIMEAHIGIGLYGQEGLRAVQASDFSIGEFKFLRHLLFFHGRNNKKRLFRMIIYFFYKNFVFTLVHFFYAFFCLSSGQSIMDDWFITFYNLVFTSLPLGVRACTDFDLLPTDGKLVNEMLPFLYKESIITEEFNYKKIVFYLSKGLLISFINFIIIEKCVGNNILNSKGDPENLWFDSFILYTNIIINVSITLLTLVKYFTFLMPLIMGIFTFVIYIIFCLIGDKYLNFNSKSTIINSLKCPLFYLILILVCFLNFMMDYFIYNFKFFFNLSMSSLLFHLFIDNELDNPIEKLPNLIKNAKKSIEIINKYNNFNMIKDNSYYSQTKLFKSMGEESKKYFRANSDNFINFVFKKKKISSNPYFNKKLKISNKKLSNANQINYNFRIQYNNILDNINNDNSSQFINIIKN